jgi:hypothetical protein
MVCEYLSMESFDWIFKFFECLRIKNIGYGLRWTERFTDHFEDILDWNWEDDHFLVDGGDIFGLNDFECSENLYELMPNFQLWAEFLPLFVVGDGLLFSDRVKDFYDSVDVCLHGCVNFEIKLITTLSW